MPVILSRLSGGLVGRAAAAPRVTLTGWESGSRNRLDELRPAQHREAGYWVIASFGQKLGFAALTEREKLGKPCLVTPTQL